MADIDPYTLYVLLDSEPDTLNYVIENDSYAQTVHKHIYDKLVNRHEDTLEIIPELAEKWEISPNKLRYRFYLKKGILWSDGVEFTADDVVYSFKAMKDPKVSCPAAKVYYIDVKDVVKVNKYTVDFIYSRPYYLGLLICGSLSIVPKHIFDDGTDLNTHKYNRHPIGTGPYKFERWETGKEIVLTRNERYWGQKPEIKRVVYKIISERHVALQLLKKGELDVMALRAIQWVRQTNSEDFNKKFYKLKWFSPFYGYIGWNAQRDLFKDKRVRRALTHLVNRKDILDKLLFGLGKQVIGPFFFKSDVYNKSITPLPFDPQKAQEILAEVGWKDSDGDGVLDRGGKKFAFTFTVTSGSEFSERLATIMKEDFAKAGIEMNINRYEWAVFLNKIRNRDFDALTLGWTDPDFQDDQYQIWHSSQIDNQGSNYVGFRNAEADDIIERARKEFDDKKRKKLYMRFQEIIHEEQPYTFLYATMTLGAVSKRFDNVKVHTKGLKYEEWKVRVKDRK